VQQQEVRVPLPLLLAGPILRRVEPTLVSVWVALRDAATASLMLWENCHTRCPNSFVSGFYVAGMQSPRAGEYPSRFSVFQAIGREENAGSNVSDRR
jgi:hypothetical protein